MELPKLFHGPLPEGLRSVAGFQNLETNFPTLSHWLREETGTDVWLSSKNHIVSLTAPKGSGACSLRLQKNGGKEVEDLNGFLKVTHLLDPVSWIRGDYQSGKVQETEKLANPMNQAYVEALAAYSLGKLAEEDYSPHFHRFYGAFCAKAEAYAYNISDSFSTFRNCRWFWNGQEKGFFQLDIDSEVEEEVREALFHPPEDLKSDTESEEEETSDSEEELEDRFVEEGKLETGSLKSASLGDLSTLDSDTDQDTDRDDTSSSDEDGDSNSTIQLFAKMRDFPVMLICTEASEGTMDDLLDNFSAVGAKPNTAQWELIWTAWTFQIIAGLCVAQSLFGFTHNDLHTNNIVWVKTDKPFLYYSARDGRFWKVPTYGRLFRIIDFGRSIFSINGKLFYSDDFEEGNDAAEQYNFGALKVEEDEEVVEPNPSFDLCRFAVSYFESLFPVAPSEKAGGSVLSSEEGLMVVETESELYNLLWSWMVCTDGTNVLMKPDGRERYPDFDLYKVIARKIKRAVPRLQINRPVFEGFRIKKKQVPLGQKVYSLFC